MDNSKENLIRKILYIHKALGYANHIVWDMICISEGSDEDAIDKIYELLHDHTFLSSVDEHVLTKNHFHNVSDDDENDIDRILTYCRNNDIHIIDITDERYPDRLKSIYNPPLALFCKGDLSLLSDDTLSISISGSSILSPYGAGIMSFIISNIFCGIDVNIVTGCDGGTETRAAAEAASHNIKSIVIPYCGFCHMDLKPEDDMSNRLIISECDPFYNSNMIWNGHRRLVIGLSNSILVIESTTKSPAMTKAHLAFSMGRDVFVVSPHDILDRRYFGGIELIKDGAKCFTGGDDIIYEYFEQYGSELVKS